MLRGLLAATGLLRPAFRLRERLRALGGAEPPATGPDGLPLPRRIHIVRVAGHADWRQFYDTGLVQAQVFADLAAAAGVPLATAGAVLDWGCGCGRISRHLGKLTPARIIGRDLDTLTVGWAADNLPGDFRPCGLSPPLDLADGAVDVVVSLSVFTHLGLAGQAAWLAELARILRPGGLLLLTFMDERYPSVSSLGPARAELQASGFAVTTAALEGTNHTATFQTRAQLSASAAPWFDDVDARASGDTALHQAVIALIRR